MIKRKDVLILNLQLLFVVKCNYIFLLGKNKYYMNLAVFDKDNFDFS